MKNLLYLLKQSSHQSPDNYTNTTVELTGIGRLIVGFILGIILTFIIIVIIKCFIRTSNDDKNNSSNNNDNDIDKMS